MSQVHQFIPPTYITPIVCPNCGETAHLVERKLLSGDSELRTFECERCHWKTEMHVPEYAVLEAVQHHHSPPEDADEAGE